MGKRIRFESSDDSDDNDDKQEEIIESEDEKSFDETPFENENERENKIDYSKLKSIDDLPSDDSISLSSSSDGEDDDPSDEEIDKELTLGERLAQRTQKPQKKLFKTPAKLAQETTEKEISHSTNKSKRKKSKHAPTEVSSSRDQYRKEKKSRLKNLGNSGFSSNVIINDKYKPRDPRMTSLCGHFDANVFDKRYGFIEEMEEKELETLELKIQARKHPERFSSKEALYELGYDSIHDIPGTLQQDMKQLSEIKSRKKHRQMDREKRNTKHEMKQSIKDAVESGKQKVPHHISDRDVKKKLLEKEFHKLKKNGNLESVLEQKRRKKSKQRF